MISIAEAINSIKEQTPVLPPVRVTLAEARGRVLAEDVKADTDLPPFDRAVMDGYAVRAVDVRDAAEGSPVRLRLAGEAAAGAGWRGELGIGEAVRIMTGAPVPAGADSVQQVEVTREAENGAVVEIDRPTTSEQFIIRRGREVRAGHIALRAGDELNAASIAALASFGYASVKVGARPRVVVLATGAELVGVEQQPAADQIRDSNTHTLSAYAEAAGAIVKHAPIAGDDLQLLQSVIAEAARRANVLVLSGGVSMGVYDFTKTALRALGAEIFFERVRLRPGKPTVFARLGDALVFGLPGNPVSVAVTFNLFARTALRVMQGARTPELAEQHAVLARAVKGSLGRASYLPATLRTDEAGRLVAEPLRWGGSSDFVAFVRASALVIVPEATTQLEADVVVRVVRLPE